MTNPPQFDSDLPASIEAERTLLGAVLLDNKAWDEIHAGMRPDDFSLDSHRRIALRMAGLFKKERAVDIVTLAAELDRYHERDVIGGVSYLASLTEGLPRRPVIEEYIRIVKDKSQLRRLMAVCSQALQRAQDQGEPSLEIIGSVQGQLEGLTAASSGSTGPAVADFAVAVLDRMVSEYQTKKTPCIPSGNAWLDAKTGGGYRMGKITIVAARPKIGKALRLDEPIKTPAGWKNNGELQVGDEVASIDGEPSFVTAIYPQGMRKMYSVAFSDGRSLECDGEHLWLVYFRQWSAPRVLTTLQVLEKLTHKRYQKRMWIDTVSGNFGIDESLPLHPWLLGALIGDGGFTHKTSCRFTTADAWMVEKVRRTMPVGCDLKVGDNYNYRLNGKAWKGKGKRRQLHSIAFLALEQLGLRGVGSKRKFIPKIYLNASERSRKQLLRGLMDTDGSIEGGGTLSFNTSSRQLALDVQELARSLGATAKIVSREAPQYPYKGELRSGSKAYRVMISHRRLRNFVSIPRKRNKLQNQRRENRLTISSVKPTAIQGAQCITVSHPSELYIAGHGYVVTHNTGFAVSSSAYNLQKGRRVVWFSLEMERDEILKNHVPYVVDIPNVVVNRPWAQTPEQHRAITQAIGTIVESWPLSVYDGDMDCDQVCWTIDRETRKGDEVLFILDHFGLMTSSEKDIRKRYVENSDRLRRKMKHKKAALLSLFQLNEVPREFSDKRPQAGDIGESKKPLQDCFAMLLLHRYMDKETLKMTRKANLNLALLRGGGSSGNVDCEFDTHRLCFDAPAELDYDEFHN
jgi:replicative DNA helicase